MKLPPSNLSLPGSDSTKESKDEGEGSAGIAMRPYADQKWDTKSINAMGLDQPCLSPGSLQRQSSLRGSIGSGSGSRLPTPGTQTAPVDVSKPQTCIFWKEPSRGAKRRAKAAAAAKTAAVSPNDLDLPAQVLVSETRHENMIQFMRGTSHSDTDDDSDDNDLQDVQIYHILMHRVHSLRGRLQLRHHLHSLLRPLHHRNRRMCPMTLHRRTMDKLHSLR